MNPLTASQRLQQIALRAALIRDASALWSTWNGDRATWERLLKLANEIVNARYQTSAGLGAAYFERLALQQTGRAVHATMPPPLAPERIAASLGSTGLAGTIRASKAGMPLAAAKQTGFVLFQGSMGRLALEGGRLAIVGSAVAATRSRGWTRAVGGGACEFCQGLEGEVSSSDAFQAHDNCACTAEPVFS